MNTFTFRGVKQPAVNGLIGELKFSGAAVGGVGSAANPITIIGHGITASATYDLSSGDLVVTVSKKPFYIPAAVIQTQLGENLSKFGYQPTE